MKLENGLWILAATISALIATWLYGTGALVIQLVIGFNSTTRYTMVFFGSITYLIPLIVSVRYLLMQIRALDKSEDDTTSTNLILNSRISYYFIYGWSYLGLAAVIVSTILVFESHAIGKMLFGVPAMFITFAIYFRIKRRFLSVNSTTLHLEPITVRNAVSYYNYCMWFSTVLIATLIALIFAVGMAFEK